MSGHWFRSHQITRDTTQNSRWYRVLSSKWEDGFVCVSLLLWANVTILDLNTTKTFILGHPRFTARVREITNLQCVCVCCLSYRELPITIARRPVVRWWWQRDRPVPPTITRLWYLVIAIWWSLVSDVLAIYQPPTHNILQHSKQNVYTKKRMRWSRMGI